jgi:hypothetical protein
LGCSWFLEIVWPALVTGLTAQSASSAGGCDFTLVDVVSWRPYAERRSVREAGFARLVYIGQPMNSGTLISEPRYLQ